MTITVANYKDGCGKTSVSMSYAVSRNLMLVTNIMKRFITRTYIPGLTDIYKFFNFIVLRLIISY